MEINIDEIFDQYLVINGYKKDKMTAADLIKAKQVLFINMGMLAGLIDKHLIKEPETNDSEVNIKKLVFNIQYEIGRFNHIQDMHKDAVNSYNKADFELLP
jgi:hypothetical protein